MKCKECGEDNGRFHYMGVPPYDGKFFQECYECENCGHVENTKVIPFFSKLIYQDIPASTEGGLTKDAPDRLWRNPAGVLVVVIVLLAVALVVIGGR